MSCAPKTKPSSTVAKPSSSTPPTACPSKSRATSPANTAWMWTKQASKPLWTNIALPPVAAKPWAKSGGEDAEFFAGIFKDLHKNKKLGEHGVEYDPYTSPRAEGEVLALIVNGQAVESASFGDQVEVILPKTGFYIEFGGQVNERVISVLSPYVSMGSGSRRARMRGTGRSKSPPCADPLRVSLSMSVK